MSKRGNPDNLRAAAQRKHAAALGRAEQAVNALVRNGESVSFRAVARLAECSPDFLYRTRPLRARIEQLRGQPRRMPAKPPTDSTSAIVRALAAQLADEKRRRREEVAALEAALAAAHGELLELRRRRAATSAQPSA